LKDYYKVLGVSRTSTRDEIRIAYRSLAKKHHPDSNLNDPSAEERFKRLNEAYGILYDDDKRAEYDTKIFGDSTYESDEASVYKGAGDASRRNNINHQDFARTGAIFEEFFSFNPKTKEYNPKRKDDNIKPMKTKDAFDAIFGKKRF